MKSLSQKIHRFTQSQSAVILAALVMATTLGSRADQIRAADPQPLSVTLIIDYNDGVEKHFTSIPWKKGMTILDAMQHARRGSHGITYQHTGSGTSAFLTKIDDLKNEGGGKESKNWILRVNKKLATKSFAVYELKADDVIRWRFEKFKT